MMKLKNEEISDDIGTPELTEEDRNNPEIMEAYRAIFGVSVPEKDGSEEEAGKKAEDMTTEEIEDIFGIEGGERTT